MQTIPLEEAQNHLAEIVGNLQPGEEILLTQEDKPVATLRAPLHRAKQPRFGTLRGTILNIAPDFDAIPEGFQEYLT